MTTHDFVLQTPATKWEDGLPLGNGLLGTLVWGDGGPLNLSLDRTDLWDLRPIPEWELPEYTYATIRQWHASGRHEESIRLLEEPYSRPAPTKIPAGRLTLALPGKVTRSTLDVTTAVAMVNAGPTTLRLFVHAVLPLGVALIESSQPFSAQLIMPDFAGARLDASLPGIGAGGLSNTALARLGYAAATSEATSERQGFVQPTWNGANYSVQVAWKRVSASSTLLVWSVALGTPTCDAGKTARTTVDEALAAGWESLLSSHQAWWSQYWSRSSVRLPNRELETLWYHEQYRFAAATHRGAPPITLQGPWTADNGQLPPWKGDYHHDLNTQLSYWPCYAANHLEEGLAYLDWLWAVREEGFQWTKRFWQMPGLNVPMCTDVSGRQIGGWRQYTHSATTGAWLAHHFYLHWRYSQDREFLTDRAWPWLRDCAIFIEAVTTERGADGKRTLPLSSTPEMFGNNPEAWFSSITNHDLSLIRWLLGATAELAEAVGQPAQAFHWRQVLAEMPQLAIAEDGRLLLAQGMPLPESHRHHAHLMAIHPLGLVDHAMGDPQQSIIRASMKELEQHGPSQWCGYSWAWLGCLRARARDGEGAAEAVQIFRKAFCSRNGFHVNGDQTGTKQYSSFEYNPFTLEGNFAAAAAIQEMLISSHGGIIEPFVAIPAQWQEIAFTLRAEGGFMITAERRAGQVIRLEVRAERAGSGRIRRGDGSVAIFTLRAGEVANFGTSA